ncbi:MAG TPA: TonB-dependent receptor [Vitreimonas sp.]|uniref:TonB-dependent receptor n=1 Tax=Vitreimonas sp. TaxID=3069702 RepID=UPI002D72D801|nr:TonB-dependent receptor [Vitreimonas sp.]HYD88035.1 TonB-dependent receptor [Vitreimonas sp.]
MSKKFGWTRILLSGASLAALGATPALAQDEGEVSEEIVVTATGRAAAIQDVPLAVTAIGGETLENSGVQDLRDITQVAPSFAMSSGQSQSSGTTARIRGIGTGSDNPGFEAAVGIFIDGVYRARAGAALSDLPELERVEVLRGPQGTLFGRNTSAGAISVITAGPDFDPGVYLETTAGLDDYEEIGARGGVNIPVTDSLAFRFDGSVRSRDGYITDLISGDDINTRDRGAWRAQMLWDISPDASLRVIADASQTDEVCCGITPLLYGPAQGVITALTGGAGTPAIDVEGRGMTVTPGRSYAEDTEDEGISAQLDWDIGGINFTSITAYRNWDAVRDQDIDFNLIDIAYRDNLEVGFENFTQEFRFQGEAGRLNWLVGLFYADEKLETTDRIRIGATSSLYANVISTANTGALFPGGCELYPFSAQPSLFQCAALSPALAPLNPGLILAVNSVGTVPGHLDPNPNGSGQSADNWNIDTESLALFTHNEFSISDRLMLTVGVRYSQETKDLVADLTSVSPSCATLQAMETATAAVPGMPAGLVTLLQTPVSGGGFGASSLMNLACNPAVNTIANGTHTGDSDEEEFSGTVSLSYDISDDIMLYGGYSRGYKAGGFNVDRSGFAITPATTNTAAVQVSDLRFDPEFTDAYELGIKSTIFGGTTTVNLTGFYQQISDYQLNAFNGFNFITRNIPDVISQGVEFEFNARPTDALTLNGGIVYTDAHYDSTVVFNPLNPGPNTVNSGDPLSLVPELTVTAGIGYEVPIGGNLSALFYLDGRWNDGYRTMTLGRNPITDNGEFAIFNGRIGIGPEDERWSVEFWGRNLTDETYYVGAFQPPLQDGTFVVYPNEPATYGVTLRASY